jgi:hypothetical protein
MNYQKIYDSLIEKRKIEKLNRKDGYCESHHIIPRCMNGTDNKENLVNLLPREHFIAHLLLVKIYPENKKLIYALWRMCNGKKLVITQLKISNRLYENLRKEVSKDISRKQMEIREKTIENRLGTKFINNGFKEKLVKEKDLEYFLLLGYELGRLDFSEDHREKISKTRREKGLGKGAQNGMYGSKRFGELNPVYGKGYLFEGEKNGRFGVRLRYVNKNGKNKMVLPEELDSYLTDGFQLGILRKKKKELVHDVE